MVSQLHRSPGVFFGQSRHANGTKLYSARVIPSRVLDRIRDGHQQGDVRVHRPEEEAQVTTLFRPSASRATRTSWRSSVSPIEGSKSALKGAVGRKLAAPVCWKTWVEDFVDEDTGEVVSIERNEVLIDRETILEEEHVDAILDSGAKTVIRTRPT